MRRGIGWRIVLASAVCVMGIVLSACLAPREGRPGDSVADGSTTSSDAGVGAQDALIPRMELEVAKAEDRLEGVFDGIGTGELKGYLVVRNTSPEALDLHVRFSHQDANREELGMHIDTFEAVAPGASALLYDATRDSGVARVGYDLTISKADASYRPIGDGVTVKESSVDDRKLVLTIANATADAVCLDDLRVEATGEGRVRRLGCAPGIAYLQPGSSDTITLDAGKLIGGERLESWAGLERVYYPNGHVEATGVSGQADVRPGDAERVPCAELAVREMGKTLSGKLGGAGPKGVKGYLLVKNETSEPMAMDVTFAYKRASGKSIPGFSDAAEIVPPGESAMLCAKCYEQGVSDVEYELRCKPSESWAHPLSDGVDVREVSADASTVTIRITNKGSSRAFLASRRCVAKDAEGRAHAAEEHSASNLEPGESLDVTFKKSSMFDPDVFYTWEGLERTYYIGGHTV